MTKYWYRCMLRLMTLSTIVCVTTPFHFPKININEKGHVTEQFQLEPHLSCVPLRNCTTYMWILRNTRKMSKVDSGQLFEVLEDKKCDVEDARSGAPLTMNTMIACPILTDDEPENEIKPDHLIRSDYEYDSENYIEDYEYLTGNENDSELLNLRHESLSVRSGIFENFYEHSASCVGSLEFSHGSWRNPLKTIEIFRLSSTWKQVRNIQRLRNRQVLRLKSNGNCCWRTYRRKRFGGRYENIYPGYDEPPRFNPKSLKKVNC